MLRTQTSATIFREAVISAEFFGTTMTNLSPDTVLQRRTGISVRIESDNSVRIEADGVSVSCSTHALSVLELFARPHRFADAIAVLQRRVSGAQDWMDLSGTVYSLHRAGLLIDPADVPPTLGTSGFGASPIHVAMLNDRMRTEQFIAAIRQTVREGDVVLDIGTGTGVLAVAAAQAGARRVYAIEAGAMADAAEQVFAANGVADRVTLLRGWSSQLVLPERADVLVSEIIGSQPLGERILETTRDAVERLLKPDARLIPHTLRIIGLPVVIPEQELRERTFTREGIAQWKEWYGISFDPLVALGSQSEQLFYRKPHTIRNWEYPIPAVELASFNLTSLDSVGFDSTVPFQVERACTVNGIAVCFQAELAEGITITTHPAASDEHCSWAVPIHILPEELRLDVGERCALRYRYRTGEEQCSIIAPSSIINE